MAYTGILGSNTSLLGNVVLGRVPVADLAPVTVITGASLFTVGVDRLAVGSPARRHQTISADQVRTIVPNTVQPDARRRLTGSRPARRLR